jgi:fructose-1,6-bisphosphatase/inositol monophosphatase family enzyme
MASVDFEELLLEASEATVRHLQASDGMERITIAEGQFHSGDDPIRVDKEAHAVFDGALRRAEERNGRRTIYAIAGEEQLAAIPDGLGPGIRVVIVDPLDGSAQWSMLRSAFCVSAYSLIADQNGRMRLECAVLTDTSRYYVWSHAKGVRMGLRGDAPDRRIRLDAIVDENGLDAPSIAFTGFKPKDRPALLSVAKSFNEWNLITIGGNPVTPYVLTGSLTAAVTLRPQATWDAVGILMATQTDAVVGALDGTIVNPYSFQDIFQEIALTGNVRRVPAMIVAKNQRRFEEVVERLGPLADEGLIVSPFSAL